MTGNKRPEEIQKYLDKGIRVITIAQILGLTKQGVYYYINKYNLKKVKNA